MAGKKFLNTTEVATGKDGELFIQLPPESGVEDTIFYAEVNTFHTSAEFVAVDAQPVGHFVVGSVVTGVKFNLEYTEMMVRDDLTTEPLLEALAKGYVPVYQFRGKIKKPGDPDENYQAVVYKSAVPSGTFDIQNLEPGDIVQRQHTFRLNEVPTLIHKMASTYLQEIGA